MLVDKYKQMINKKFGHLTLVEVEELEGLVRKNRKRHVLHFVCDCGTKKSFNASSCSSIFNGATVSCGCKRKVQWGKSYYAWKKDWHNKGLL